MMNVRTCATIMAWLLVLGCRRPALENPRRTPVVTAVERTMTSVVNIGTERVVKVLYDDPSSTMRGTLIDRFFRDWLEPTVREGYRTSHSLGSGVVIHADGYILTNYHVMERASVIHVTLADETPHVGRIIAGDPVHDLALVKIDVAEPLRAIELAGDDDLLLGEPVIALGNPYGLAHSVTVGVLSAMNREARYRGEVLFRDILQTDAAVNPGNSGGPLINLDGRLIGVNIAIYQEAQNIGFAMPVKRVRALLGRWLSPENLQRTTLGMSLEEEGDGPRVASVTEGGTAHSAAVRPGDQVVSVDGIPVASLFDVGRALVGSLPGDLVEVRLRRKLATRDVVLAVTPLPRPSGERLADELLGVVFAREDDMAPVMPAPGLMIRALRPGGIGLHAGLQPGYFVARINDREIRSLDDVGLALENVRHGDPLTLSLVRIREEGSYLVRQGAAVRLLAGDPRAAGI